MDANGASLARYRSMTASIEEQNDFFDCTPMIPMPSAEPMIDLHVNIGLRALFTEAPGMLLQFNF